MSEPTDDDAMDDSKERRKQGIHVKLPGGTELTIAGPFTILALLLVLLGGNCWISWEGVKQLVKLGDNVVAQGRAINMMSCMLQEMEPAKRKAQYEECQRWFR